MPIEIQLAAEPEGETTPDEAKEYLVAFVYWLQGFFHQVVEFSDEVDEETGAPLFEDDQIRFLPDVLDEMKEEEHFDRLVELVKKIENVSIREHGLHGLQLKWKLSNINFSLRRFIEQRTAAMFDRLLSSIDALLDSILGAVPGGSAVKELKEAIRNSVAIATE